MPRKATIKTTKAKKPAKRPDLDVPESALGFIEPTVRIGEDVASRYGVEALNRSLIARSGAAYVKMCAHRNAQNVAAHAIRLYVPASSGRKGLWPTRPVKDRKRNDYLRNPVIGKSADYAMHAGDVMEVVDNPVMALINNPNQWQTRTEFIHSMAYSDELSGNIFLYTPYIPGDGTDFLMPLQPQYTRVVASRTEFIAGYMYGRESTREVFIGREEVAHGKLWPSLENPYLGEGPLHTVFRQADFAALAADSDLARIMNGSRPDLILKVPQTATNDEIKVMEAKIRAKHAGPQKAGAMHVFRDVEVVPVGYPPRDMEWMKAQDEAWRAIWAAFGIPESMFRLNDANLASSTTGHRQYQEQTILPRQRVIADLLTTRLLPRFGIMPGEGWFVFDNPVQADKESDQRVYGGYVKDGLLTINEARAELGYEPVEGGDDIRIQGQKLEKLDAPPTPMFGLGGGGKEDPEDGPEEDPPAPGPASVDEEPTEDAAEQETEAKAMPGEVVFMSELPGCPCGNHHHKDDDDDLRAIKILATKFANDIDPKLRAIIADMVARIESEAQPHAKHKLVEELKDTISANMQAIALEGGKRGLAKLSDASIAGGMFDVLPESAIRQIDEYSTLISQNVTETARAKIAAAIRTGLAEGQSIPEIAKALQAQLPDMSQVQAEAIARTETSYALNRGELVAWKSSGIQSVEWVLAGGPCPICEALKAQHPGPVPIDSAFAPIGSSIVGTDGKTYIFDYRTITEPPAHVNCRCTLVPVFTEGSTDASAATPAHPPLIPS